jgi:hypothetical protein
VAAQRHRPDPGAGEDHQPEQDEDEAAPVRERAEAMQ